MAWRQFARISVEFFSMKFNWWTLSIGLYNGLAEVSNAIIWTNGDPITGICASLEVSGINIGENIMFHEDAATYNDNVKPPFVERRENWH